MSDDFVKGDSVVLHASDCPTVDQEIRMAAINAASRLYEGKGYGDSHSLMLDAERIENYIRDGR